ncbi:MAG: YjgN family protein [Coriobacteriia bacterium]|nr:YjgN family protein [Coriobacteriia bacterium]
MRIEGSYFDGGLAQLIGYKILGYLVTVFTLGICYPWACTMLYRWETKHTVVEGRRLEFTGTAAGLVGQWIKWLLLSIITLGIYSFWVNIKLKKWRTEHTRFQS